MQQMAPQRTTSSGYSSFAIFGGDIRKDDLLFGAKREPAAHRIVFDVAHDVFDKWFTVENLHDKHDRDLDNKVQSELQSLNAKDIFTQVVAMERIYGWAVLAYQFADSGQDLSQPAVNVIRIERLIAYYDTNVSQVLEDQDENSDRYGLPEYIEVSLKAGGKQRIQHSRFYWLATRLLGHNYIGQSALEPVMDDLTVLRNIRWGLGMTMVRYGSGFPDVTLEGADLTAINAFIDSGQFNNLSAMKYFVHNADQKLEFKGMGSSTLDPIKYILPILESISLGSGIPVAVLRGAQAGALTGSEVNEREYFRLISDIQGRVEPMVRDLINKILSILFADGKVLNYRVNWNGLFQQSEEDKLKCVFAKERINQLRTNYMTVNEIRASELGENESIAGGDIVLSLASLQAKGPPIAGAFDVASTDEESISNLQKQLTLRLNGLIANVKESKMTEDEALIAAEITIEEHINSMKKIAKLNLEQKLNRPITELSPENQRDFAVLKKSLLDDFKRILKDAL
jgi:uncharacterized protein YnzC (UPF0291/DUF896 family)